MPSRSELPVLVSACLLGRRCRYDGDHDDSDELRRELAQRGERAIPYCPEEAGGLGTPRPPAWLEAPAEEVLAGHARVLTEDGRDVTSAFRAGAEGALAAARHEGVRRAYLKERSPSCGVCSTHVAGECVPGPGITAALLRWAGIDVQGR